MSDRTDCPYCKEQVHVDATACPHCTRAITGPNKGEVTMADRSARRGIGIILFIQLAMLVVLLAINAGLS